MSEDAQISRPRRVSVIVPTYNRPQMLRQALASIRALEGPDLTFEILIGDNGHAPETATVAAEFGAVHLKTSEGGSGEARNVAMKALTSEYFTFLDDDDVLLPGAVRPHLAVLDAKPELLGVIGQVVYADENLNPTTPPSPAESPGKGDALIRAMLGDWFPQVGTTVVRRSVLDLVGLFDPRHGEDVDWFLRLARTRKVEFIPTPCILFRGRPAGSFDALNRARAKGGRRVFLKHALAEWRIWKGPRDFFAGYRSRLIHLFIYFHEGAKAHAAAGRYGAALRGTLDAAYIFPARATLRFVFPSALRKSLKAIVRPGGAKSQKSNSQAPNSQAPKQSGQT